MKKDPRKRIITFYRDHRRMPSYREIAELLGYKSKNAVFKLVEKLEASGLLRRDDGRLVPVQLFGETRVLGVVEAGFPSAAEEELVDTMSLDDYLIDNREATYLLKVKGDSMIEAGICEGDMVLVERGKQPKDKDIVIAEVDGGWTMKYFRKQGSKIWLEPANKKMKAIFPKAELNIAAVVRAVVRKY